MEELRRLTEDFLRNGSIPRPQTRMREEQEELNRLTDFLRDHPILRPQTLEDHTLRLAELNIALCSECLMPENPNDLMDGLCKECRE
jgi:hypothetical protein